MARELSQELSKLGVCCKLQCEMHAHIICWTASQCCRACWRAGGLAAGAADPNERLSINFAVLMWSSMQETAKFTVGV